MRTRLAVLVLAALSILPTVAAQSPPTQPPTGGIDVTAIDIALPPIVGEGTSSVVTVRNTGSTPVSVTIAWSYGDGGPLNDGAPRQAFNSAADVVQPGMTSPISLGFTPSVARRGHQTISATMSATVNGQAVTETISHVVFVAESKLNLTIANVTNETAPEGASFARFFLRNDGNANETPTFRLDIDPDAQGVVNYSLQLMSNFSTILPGQSVTGFVLVRPLTTNLTSANLSANLTVNSSVLPTRSYRAQLPPFHLNDTVARRGYVIEATTPPATQQVIRGETLGIPVTLTNRGGAPDVYAINLTLDKPQPWSARLALNATSANVSAPVNGTFYAALLPGESIALDALVTLDAAGQPPLANLTLDAISLQAPLLGAIDPEGRYHTTRRVLLSPAGPDLAVGAIKGPQDAYPGEPASISVVVENRGRVLANASTADLVVQDNLRTIFQRTIPVRALGPGESQQVSWAVPTEALKGAYRFAATVQPNATDVDMDPANNLGSQPLYVRSPLIELRVPDEIVATPGTTLLLQAGDNALKLANKGDREEVVVATLRSDEASWLAAGWRITVPSGGVVSLPLEIAIPQHVGKTRVAAELSADIAGHAGHGETVDLEVQVRPVAPPSIALVSPTQNGRVGASAEIRVRAIDAIQVEHAQARVILPGGEVVAVPLLPVAGAPDEYAGAFSPQAAGTHTLQLSASGSGTPLRTGTLSASWNVTTGGYAGVVPVGFGEGATINNRTLAFAEAAPGTTRALFVDVGDGYQPVSAPYVVSADFWRDGAHAIGVRAVSNEGDTWTRTYNVTLASSPPALSSPEVTTLSSGQVLIAVDAKGASTVVAKLSADGKTIEVPLTQSGAGRFSARFDPPAGWSSTTLTATASSGVQTSLVVDAPGKSRGVPAPGLGLVVLGLAAIAVLRRRG